MGVARCDLVYIVFLLPPPLPASPLLFDSLLLPPFLFSCRLFSSPLSFPFLPVSFLSSSSRLGLLQGARGDLLRSLPAASTPVGLSFVTLFLSVFLPGLLARFFSSLSLSLSPPSPISLLPSPPIPHGGAAALNAWKHAVFTYITSAVQLMSWSVSAVKWCQSCLERQRACWVGQYVRSYSWAEHGERGDPRICLLYPPIFLTGERWRHVWLSVSYDCLF